MQHYIIINAEKGLIGIIHGVLRDVLGQERIESVASLQPNAEMEWTNIGEEGMVNHRRRVPNIKRLVSQQPSNNKNRFTLHCVRLTNRQCV